MELDATILHLLMVIMMMMMISRDHEHALADVIKIANCRTKKHTIEPLATLFLAL